MSDPKERREYLQNIDEYLDELKVFASTDVNRADLSSIDMFGSVAKRAHGIDTRTATRFKMKFEEKKRQGYKNYIEALGRANDNKVYLVTHRSKYCGLYKFNSICDVNWDFDYEVNREGIVVFVTEDMEDKLTLDYSKSDDNEKVIEVEARGTSWPSVGIEGVSSKNTNSE